MLHCIRRLVALLIAGQPVPQHVAFIMDGNRRFADLLGLERIQGHMLGYMQAKKIVQWCMELGIPYISVYAFSIENYKRSQEEVAALMKLSSAAFNKLLHDKNVQRWQAELRVVGDLSKAPAAVQAAAARMVQGLKEQERSCVHVVNICFSYTSSQEQQHAVQQLVSGVADSDLTLEELTPRLLQQAMYTRECPPVDLLIRTSGEQRLSDLLLWQNSHALLHWERCLWPEFGYAHLLRALLAWQSTADALKQLQQSAEAVAAAAVAAWQQQQAAGKLAV